MSEYSPPIHVINEWKKHCDCCEECATHPCDSVCAGGVCDNLECECDIDPLEDDSWFFDASGMVGDV